MGLAADIIRAHKRAQKRGWPKALKTGGVTKKRRSSAKGTPSKTHKGRKNYTTKLGDKDFHRGGHDIREGTRKPYRGNIFMKGVRNGGRIPPKKGGGGGFPRFPTIGGARAGGRIRSGPAAVPPGLRHGGRWSCLKMGGGGC